VITFVALAGRCDRLLTRAGFEHLDGDHERLQSPRSHRQLNKNLNSSVILTFANDN
jgi:hypothetical protein